MDNIRHVVFGSNYTPQHLFKDLEAELDDMKEVVVVWMTKDPNPEIKSGWTSGSGVSKIGMLQIASSGIENSMATD